MKMNEVSAVILKRKTFRGLRDTVIVFNCIAQDNTSVRLVHLDRVIGLSSD